MMTSQDAGGDRSLVQGKFYEIIYNSLILSSFIKLSYFIHLYSSFYPFIRSHAWMDFLNLSMYLCISMQTWYLIKLKDMKKLYIYIYIVWYNPWPKFNSSHWINCSYSHMTSTKYSMGIIKQICRVKIDKMTQYMYFKGFFFIP